MKPKLDKALMWLALLLFILVLSNTRTKTFQGMMKGELENSKKMIELEEEIHFTRLKLDQIAKLDSEKHTILNLSQNQSRRDYK